jgi:hypothetical protein
MARVVCGANEQAMDAGQTVAQARENFKEILNIPDGAKAIVNGDEVGEDYTLNEGDSLEFIKSAGGKGRKM